MEVLGTAGEMGTVIIIIMVLFGMVKKIAFVKRNPLVFLTGFSIVGVVLVDYQGGFSGPLSGQVVADWLIKGFVQALAAAKLYERFWELITKAKPTASVVGLILLMALPLAASGCALLGSKTDSVTQAYYQVKTANAAYNAAREQFQAAAEAGKIDPGAWAFATVLSRGYVDSVGEAGSAIAAYKEAPTAETVAAMNEALKNVELQLGLFMGYLAPLLKE